RLLDLGLLQLGQALGAGLDLLGATGAQEVEVLLGDAVLGGQAKSGVLRGGVGELGLELGSLLLLPLELGLLRVLLLAPRLGVGAQLVALAAHGGGLLAQLADFVHVGLRGAFLGCLLGP